jgi:5'-deoxynucleotidase YfbR-like HD superfamily hydrolase
MSNEHNQLVRPLRFNTFVPEVWNKLGEIPRTGWVNRKVTNPETVREHTCALRVISYSVPGFSEEDHSVMLDMLEVHDYPEAVLGDEVIVTNDQAEKARRKELKFEKEKKAMIALCSPIGNIGNKIFSLWFRFETADDPVSQCARDLDKYQAIRQALFYETTQGIACFKEFLDYSRPEIKHPFLLASLQGMEAQWRQHNHSR